MNIKVNKTQSHDLKILICGGNGFVGKHLTQRLLTSMDQSCLIRVLDIKEPQEVSLYNKTNHLALNNANNDNPPKYEYFQGDISNFAYI